MRMTDQTRKAEQFRASHIPGKPLVLLNIWDAGGAKAVAAGWCQSHRDEQLVGRECKRLLRWRTHAANFSHGKSAPDRRSDGPAG